MTLYFFAEFPPGCDSRVVDAALRPMATVFEVLWLPKVNEGEREALSITVQPRRDPLVLLENLIELFDVLERRFNAVIFEVQTGRRYGKKHFRGPLN